MFIKCKKLQLNSFNKLEPDFQKEKKCSRSVLDVIYN